MIKTYIIEQKIVLLANQYRVFETTDTGVKANLIAFAHQKRFAFKEQVTFFTDESKSSTAFEVKAEKVMDVHGKFFVTDARGNTLGALRKVFGTSLLRSTWEVLDTNDAVQAIVRERRQSLAIFRRVWQFIPYLSDFPFFLKYHFDFIQPSTQTNLGSYEKTTLITDNYRLVLDEDLIAKVSWQTLIAQAILLDALQGR